MYIESHESMEKTTHSLGYPGIVRALSPGRSLSLAPNNVSQAEQGIQSPQPLPGPLRPSEREQAVSLDARAPFQAIK